MTQTRVACERQMFLLVHRRWGTFREDDGISAAESQTFLLAKRPSAAMNEEKRLLFASLRADEIKLWLRV